MNKNTFICSSNIKLFSYLFLGWSLAVAQPLMRSLGQQPVFFVAHEMRGWSLIYSTFSLNIIPPILLFCSLYVLGFVSQYLKEWMARLTIFALFTLFVLTLVSSHPSTFALSVSVVVAILFTVALIETPVVKTYALWLAPISMVFIVLFLFFSPTHQLISFSKKVALNSKTSDKGPIFIFTFDEMPLISLLKNKNKIDDQRFPAFAQFAKQATWYPNAHAIANSTDIALPAILSGIKPSTTVKKLGTFQQYPNSLFTLFANSHSIHAIENTTRICPPYLCKPLIKNPYQLLAEDVFVSYLYQIFPQDKKGLLPPINDRWVGFLREMKNEKRKSFDFSARLNKFNDFVNSLADYPENTLHFLHILLPHAPWRLLPDLKLYGFYEHDGIPGELAKDDPLAQTKFSHEWTHDQWATQLGWRRHLLQVGAVDRLLKTALDKIKDLGYYDKATIVVVADHGSAFKSGLSRRYAHNENVADIVSVPLFIKYPHQTTATVDTRFASNVDILPTLMDIFAIEDKTLKLNGISLVADKKRQQAEVMVQEDKSTWQQPDNYMQLFENSLQKKNTLFANKSWLGVFHPSDSLGFYHKNVLELNIKETYSNAISLQNANLFETFDDSSRYVPAYYRINLLLKTKQAHEILVAINDKIVSHCQTFVHAPSDCAGLIDPNEFHSGIINMRFFSVTDKNQDNYVVNELLAKSLNKAQLINHKDAAVILFDKGDQWPIDQQAIPAGEATLRLVDDGTNYQVDGWAGDTLSGQVAQNVYLFIDDKLYTTTETGVEKGYVYIRYGYKTLLDSGFHINIPMTLYPHIQQHKLRVFAKTNKGKIVELNYHADAANPEFLDAFKPFKNRAIPIDNAAVLALKIQYLDDEKLLNQNVFDAFELEFGKISSGHWYAINNHARWIGTSAIVAIPSKNNRHKITLKITAKPYLYKDILTHQRLIITVNGQQGTELVFSDKQSKTLSFNVPALEQNQPILIKLEMPDATAPADFNTNQDSRLLSLHLTEFKVIVNQ